MTDKSNQTIPDSQAVVNFIDKEILEILDSHSTFTTNELLKAIKVSGIDRTSFRDELKDMILKSTQAGHSKEIVLNKLILLMEMQSMKVDTPRMKCLEKHFSMIQNAVYSSPMVKAGKKVS